ncbi:MAG: FAD-binding oxidoreductase [Anaerolineales bacterium]|nr:FAD-binding oxidoreductase [Anaerolineales bacterium]
MDDKKARLKDIVGDGGILPGPKFSDSYSLDYNLIKPLQPCFEVKPKNVEEVQKIVLWANETQTPLVPVSSGGPHFRGDTYPTAPEAVMVDLRGMNHILKIDRRNRLALIEPGVTFSQLLPELRKEGLRIVMPLLPRGNKSVIASLLEREPVMSPRYQWNLVEPLRSLEIVWGNGDKFYSGSGTLRGEKDEDWQAGLVPVVGPGPGQLDYNKFVSAAQGSMGIVTWASVKCEVYPQTRKLFFIPAEKLEDLIDFTYKLLKFRFGDELFIVNNTCLANILGNSAAEIEALKNGLPAWTVVVGITGGDILPEEKLAAQEADICDIAQQHGLRMVPALQGIRGDELLDVILQPSPEPYWKLRDKGGSQDIFFLTTLDKTPRFITTLFAAANERGYPVPDIGIYLQPVHQGVGCHCEFILPFDRANQAEVRKTQELFREASQRLFKQGAYFSRPYGIWADMVYNADARTMLVTKKIKDIFDPKHVMNPGKLCF